MFNFFKKKTKIEKLQEEYKCLMNKAFLASKKDRTLSDEYVAKANEVDILILEHKKANL
tara:strand:- start:182 stop:358 length:177 start_codon:yes stop_codon:yes gene_type:complete